MTTVVLAAHPARRMDLDLYQFECYTQDRILGLIVSASSRQIAATIAMEWVKSEVSSPTMSLMGKASTTTRQGVVAGYTRAKPPTPPLEKEAA
jgi:hypothetical protein